MKLTFIIYWWDLSRTLVYSYTYSGESVKRLFYSVHYKSSLEWCTYRMSISLLVPSLVKLVITLTTQWQQLQHLKKRICCFGMFTRPKGNCLQCNGTRWHKYTFEKHNNKRKKLKLGSNFLHFEEHLNDTAPINKVSGGLMVLVKTSIGYDCLILNVNIF